MNKKTREFGLKAALGVVAVSSSIGFALKWGEANALNKRIEDNYIDSLELASQNDELTAKLNNSFVSPSYTKALGAVCKRVPEPDSARILREHANALKSTPEFLTTTNEKLNYASKAALSTTLGYYIENNQSALFERIATVLQNDCGIGIFYQSQDDGKCKVSLYPNSN